MDVRIAGPLTSADGTLVGVVSFGDGCGKTFGVFTRVAWHFLNRSSGTINYFVHARI